MKKRITAMLMSIVLLVGMIPGTALDVFAWGLNLKNAAEPTETQQTEQPQQAEASHTVICVDNTEVTHLNLTPKQKTTLTVASDAAFIQGYQWQILVADTQQQWIDIYDKNDEQCEVGYALLSSALDVNNNAYIRCKLTTEKGEEFSSIVGVTILKEENPAQNSEPEKVVLELETEMRVEDPNATPEPTAEPTAEPTVEPTVEPTAEPTTEPTAEPTTEPTTEPTAEPTVEPTVEPTTEPTAEPTTEPTAEPTAEPTTEPTAEPTVEPTAEPATAAEIVAETAELVEQQPVAAVQGTSALTLPAVKKTSLVQSGETAQPAEEIAVIPPAPTAEPTTEPTTEPTPEAVATEAVVEETVATETVQTPAANEAMTVADGDTEYVIITINYLIKETDDQGNVVDSEAYKPYKAKLVKNAAFEQDVYSPAFVGYKPYADRDGTQDGSVVSLKFAINELDSDRVYNIYYLEAEVDFTVKFFFQNVGDDFYTEDQSLFYRDKAITGSKFSDQELVDKLRTSGKLTAEEITDIFKGFTALYHIPEAVAADGSTQFESYYDRNYYTVNFELDGGYGVDPIYARYGTPFTVNTPKREGYTFAGWQEVKDGQLTGELLNPLSSSIPAENITYRAIWRSEPTTAKIVYWLEDPNTDGKYNFWMEKKISTHLDGDTLYAGEYLTVDDYKDEYIKVDSVISKTDEWEYSEYDSTKSNTIPDWESAGNRAKIENGQKKILLQGDDSTVVNVYYKRDQFTLKFYYSMEQNGNHYVVGGSTYYFGGQNDVRNNMVSGTDITDEVSLVSQYKPSSGKSTEVGQITAKPTLNTEGSSRNYQTGSDTTDDGIKYHYISFTAKYGANISKKWPCDVFNSATRSSSNTHGYWSGTTAYVSAWNGEYYVKYSEDNRSGNQTIKGKYEKLDETILFDESAAGKVDDLNTVAYLCFWENGADVSWSVPRLWRYKVWVPYMEGETYKSDEVKTYGGKEYRLLDIYDTCDDSTNLYNDGKITQTQPALEGFGKVNMQQETIATEAGYASSYVLNLYYSRNAGKTLKFINYDGADIRAVTGLSFGAPIENYYFNDTSAGDYKVPFPSGYEEGSRQFAGWYRSPGCYPGSEYGDHDKTGAEQFDGSKMPDGDLNLYAYWKPNRYTVRFFNRQSDADKYVEGGSITVVDTATVDHGNIVGRAINEASLPNVGETVMRTTGWFYIDEKTGEKKAFSPFITPIKSDMKVFAEWGSDSPQPYHITYVLKGTGEKVADDSVGYAYLGSTRTFNAKMGDYLNQLHQQYNVKYYPTVSSHSITIQEDDVDNVTKNRYQFEYVHAPFIKYTVRYLDKDTHKDLKPSKTVIVTDGSAIVSERYIPVVVDGKIYTPDAMYKSLPLVVEVDENNELVHETGTIDGEQAKIAISDQNVITFYYSKSDTNVAYYAVHFMLEKLGATTEELAQYNIDGSGGYEASPSIVEGISTIDGTVKFKPLEFAGFTHINDKSKVTTMQIVDGETNEVEVANEPVLNGNGEYEFTLKQNGSDLYIFYSRNSYNYTVKYLRHSDGTDVETATTGSGKYGSKVTEDAKNIDGFSVVGPTQITHTIADPSGNAAINDIVFRYTPVQYVVNYNVVIEDGQNIDNMLDITKETKEGGDDFAGSTPVLDNTLYAFAGWYEDEACTNPVETDPDASDYDGTVDPTTKRFTPSKANLDYGVDADGKQIVNNFYAKFARKAGDIVIIRDGNVDSSQVFVYEIRNSADECIYVTIKGEGRIRVKDVPYGTYTITQIDNWSWRHKDKYNEEAAKWVGTHQSTESEAPFNNAVKNKNWLNGHSSVVKNKRTTP